MARLQDKVAIVTGQRRVWARRRDAGRLPCDSSNRPFYESVGEDEEAAAVGLLHLGGRGRGTATPCRHR